MWLSFLGFFRVTVKGGGRQSLEVGAVAWWEARAEEAGWGCQGGLGGEGFCFEPHIEAVTPKRACRPGLQAPISARPRPWYTQCHCHPEELMWKVRSLTSGGLSFLICKHK